MSNVNVNMVFYSKNCKTCYKFLSLIDEHKLLQYFKLICIDGKYDALPPQIKAVPTILVRNINKPLGPEEAFNYIKNLVEYKKTRQQKSNENNIMDDYVDLELTKFSDVYTFLDHDNASKQVFFGYKEEEKHAIHTAPLENKLNKKDQDKRIKDMEAERYDQEKKFKIDMRQEQRIRMDAVNKPRTTNIRR